MPLHVWRRQHGQEFMAQVETVDEIGTWRISVWPTASPNTRVIVVTATVRLLQSAQAQADALAQKMFDHRCADDSCGVWYRVDCDH